MFASNESYCGLEGVSQSVLFRWQMVSTIRLCCSLMHQHNFISHLQTSNLVDMNKFVESTTKFD